MSSTYTPTPWTRAISTEIVETMARRDVTVDELAALTGLGPIALRNRLDGKAPWDVEQVYRVAQALLVSVWTLMAPDLAGAS